MPEYSNENTITIWFKRPDAHERAPDIKVEINDSGKETEFALWKRGPNDNPNGPAYKGKVEHKSSDKAGYTKQQPSQTASPKPADDFSQDIPF